METEIVKILKTDERYPKLLRNLKNSPEQIYVMGDVTLLNTNCISIIGSRNCTEYGERMTIKFAKELCEYGITIVSGMAVGVDGIAHKTALDCLGKTIAVLPCGLKNIYPKENKKLFEEILRKGGCIISEYLPKVEAGYNKFLERNRIVAGISNGILVVEGAHRSGTSTTAKMAKENNRKVFCIPSSLDNPKGITPNWLIQKGAILVINVEDILMNIEDKEWRKINLTNKIIEENSIELNVNIKEENQNINKKEIDKEYLEIYNIIKNENNIHLNDIVRKTNKEISKINYQLTMMELEGLIEQNAGKFFRII